MLRRLLPRETSFFDFFERHAAFGLKGARELSDFCANPTDPKAMASRIKAIEQDADGVTQSCREALHKTFITPIDRYDIHRLTNALDDVVDWINGVARRISLYEVGGLPEPFRRMAELLVQATESIEGAVTGLRDMKNADDVLAACTRVKQLEKDADSIYARALAGLFKEESDPIAVIKWREIYESLESAIDACEDLATVIEGVVLEHS
jgi:predicted phosphate transport protein (TIGR00153 family)